MTWSSTKLTGTGRSHPQEADKLSGPALFELTLSPGNTLDVKATVGGDAYSKRFTAAGPAHYSRRHVHVYACPRLRHRQRAADAHRRCQQSPVDSQRLCGSTQCRTDVQTTSIVIVSLKNTNKRRGEDFINKLIEVYNRNTNNDKNEVAEKTEEFIAGRIRIINDELFSTEKELETFKRDAGLTDLASDAQLAVSENSAYEKQRVENGTQLNLVSYLAEYISAPDKVNTVLPVNVGLTDQSLPPYQPV